DHVERDRGGADAEGGNLRRRRCRRGLGARASECGTQSEGMDEQKDSKAIRAHDTTIIAPGERADGEGRGGPEPSPAKGRLEVEFQGELDHTVAALQDDLAEVRLGVVAERVSLGRV